MLRSFMLRHGAHHVNIWSLSGSSARPDVHQSVPDDPFELRPLLGQLADRVRLPLLGMHVHLGPRDVEIAADHQRALVARASAANCSSAAEEAHLRRKILAAIRDVH